MLPASVLSLGITKQADAFILSWPSTFGTAVLEFAPDLDPDSWGTLNLTPTLEGDLWQLTLPEVSGSGFYRLSDQE